MPPPLLLLPLVSVRVDRLQAQCRAAGLTGAAAGDDASRLHALFDVALSHGLGSIVVDYVFEVCSDRFYTSRCAAPALLLLCQAAACLSLTASRIVLLTQCVKQPGKWSLSPAAESHGAAVPDQSMSP
jgi:hypothetical protein